MSQQLIGRSPDLKRLRDEGHNLELLYGHLVVRDIPYVNTKKEIGRGIIVSELNLAGDVTGKPGDHTVYFGGDYPCDRDGQPLNKIVIESTERRLGENLVVHHRFSSKPPLTGGVYRDYYEKISTYIAILSSQAQALDPQLSAQTYPAIAADEADPVFQYVDTASSRAGISIANQKLGAGKIAIVGVGGTGSYILDLVAKTPVREIHLFDGDTFYQHNAFRSPGAATLDELRASPKKVDYFAQRYGAMRHGIVVHPYDLDETNAHELKGMDFAFVSMDAGDAKAAVVDALEKFGVPFIDVGLGVQMVEESLRGTLRVTSNTPETRDHFRKRVSLGVAGVNREYDRNIQIADLNALNAALAVIKWKKLCGFYWDFEKESHSTYTISSGLLLNEDIPCGE